MNRTFMFVRVFESGEEEQLPTQDVAEATRLAKEQKGLECRGYLDGDPGLEPLSEHQRVTIEADGVMAIIYQLSNMPKYRGMRLDAVEVDTYRGAWAGDVGTPH